VINDQLFCRDRHTFISFRALTLLGGWRVGRRIR